MSRDYKINLEKQFTIQFGTELKPFMTDYLAVINWFFRIDESVNEPILAGVPFAAGYLLGDYTPSSCPNLIVR
jgi:hypothetical protein